MTLNSLKAVFLAAAFAMSVTYVQAKPIKITNGEWEPYLSQYSYQYGLASHIVEEAFADQEVEVTWGFFPWVRSYKLAEAGTDWVASAVWSDTEKFRKDFLASNPVIRANAVFFHRKDYDFDWTDFNSLKGEVIGLTKGYDYGYYFERAIRAKDLTIEWEATDETNFNKLMNGRITIFPNDSIAGRAQLQSMYGEEAAADIVSHPKPLVLKNLVLLISKNVKDKYQLLLTFNQGLYNIENNGVLDEIYQNYDRGLYKKGEVIWESTQSD